jgi:2-haloacid dehalogenase
MTEHVINSASPSAQGRGGTVVPSICVFDVNETLLDIEFIAPLFARLFGDSRVMREWFGQLILYSEAITLSGPYTTFLTLGQGVLEMLGSIHNVSIQKDDIEELRTRLLTMPAHPDVPAGLKQLKDAGFRLVTLTNSPPDPQTSPPAKARRHCRLVRKVV